MRERVVINLEDLLDNNDDDDSGMSTVSMMTRTDSSGNIITDPPQEDDDDDGASGQLRLPSGETLRVRAESDAGPARLVRAPGGGIGVITATDDQEFGSISKGRSLLFLFPYELRRIMVRIVLSDFDGSDVARLEFTNDRWQDDGRNVDGVMVMTNGRKRDNNDDSGNNVEPVAGQGIVKYQTLELSQADSSLSEYTDEGYTFYRLVAANDESEFGVARVEIEIPADAVVGARQLNPMDLSSGVLFGLSMLHLILIGAGCLCCIIMIVLISCLVINKRGDSNEQENDQLGTEFKPMSVQSDTLPSLGPNKNEYQSMNGINNAADQSEYNFEPIQAGPASYQDLALGNQSTTASSANGYEALPHQQKAAGYNDLPRFRTNSSFNTDASFNTGLKRGGAPINPYGHVGDASDPGYTNLSVAAESVQVGSPYASNNPPTQVGAPYGTSSSATSSVQLGAPYANAPAPVDGPSTYHNLPPMQRSNSMANMPPNVGINRTTSLMGLPPPPPSR